MQQEKRLRLAVVASGVISLGLVSAALLGSRGVARHEKLRDELARVEQLNESIRTENHRLREQSRALASNPEYIESVIRDELGYVRADELVFIFPEGNKK